MEYFVYVALLSEANEALPNLLDDAIPIFVQCADTGMDSEMRLRYVEYRFLMGFYNYNYHKQGPGSYKPNQTIT